MSEIKHRAAESKINCEELDPFPLSGVGIEHNAVFGSSVLGRSLRIQHLKWISPTGSARKNAVRIFFLNRWRRRRGTSFHTSSESFSFAAAPWPSPRLSSQFQAPRASSFLFLRLSPRKFLPVRLLRRRLVKRNGLSRKSQARLRR